METKTFRAALAAICVAAALPLWAANDATMNWCGWRVSNTSTADADRDLTTFRNWFANDNPYGTTGYWWHQSNMTSIKTGSWVNPYTNGKQILVQWNQGGCGYVNTVITNVCDLRLGIAQSYKSVLRIDEGGCISNANIQVGSIVSSLTGRNARLHINGGDVFVGNDNIANAGQKGLSISYARTGEGGVFMTGGRLVVNKGFTICAEDGGLGCFALTNGTVESSVVAKVGPVIYKPVPLSDGRIIVAGGEWTAHNNITIRNGGTMEVTGGTVDTRLLQISCGGTVRMSGGYVTGGISFYNQSEPSDKNNVLNVTNTFYLAGGTLVTTNVNLAIDGNGNIVTGKGWLNGRSPARFVQSGGVHTNANLYAGSGHSRYEISGGTYWATASWVGGSEPFFFRIQGTPVVSSKGWVCIGTASNPTNCLIEHVISERGLNPITFRSSYYCQAHGHQRLRPLGGVQVVTTNFFPLFRFNRGTTVANRVLRTKAISGRNGSTPCWGTWPDASLWTLDPFDTVLPASRDVEVVSGLGSDSSWGSQDGTYYDVGCTLNAAAEKGTLEKGGGAVEFEATSMGYLVWPNTATNKVTGVKVALKVSAPEGGTLEGALAKVCAGLEEAGYENVASNASASYNVSFAVPLERVPVLNKAAKLLFDFTETPVPAGGLTKAFPMQDLPTVTNALVSGVSCKYEGPWMGLTVIVK